MNHKFQVGDVVKIVASPDGINTVNTEYAGTIGQNGIVTLRSMDPMFIYVLLIGNTYPLPFVDRELARIDDES